MNRFWGPLGRSLSPFAFVWLGFSFTNGALNALKFSTPDVSFHDKLRIGKLLFEVTNRWELAVVVMTILWVRFRPPHRIVLGLMGAIWLIVAMQNFWLTPQLAVLGQMVLDGKDPPPTLLHATYIFTELLKLVCLFLVGVFDLERLGSVVRLK